MTPQEEEARDVLQEAIKARIDGVNQTNRVIDARNAARDEVTK